MNGVAPDSMGVYRLLKRLEDQGLVAHAWNDSEEGPAKRVYELTTSGRHCLTQWIHTLEAYQFNIMQLVDMIRICAQEDESATR